MGGKRQLTLALAMMALSVADAGNDFFSADKVEYRFETLFSSAPGARTPLWLNANKHGLSSLESTNGYLRVALQKPFEEESERNWELAYGLDVASAFNFTSSVVVQQAFAELRWHKGVLTVGSKQYPMELKNQELSSGSQTLGINARPVPQVRLALRDYWDIPFTNGWVSLKGHLAFGKTTDDNWQRHFTATRSKYTQNTLYHSKAGFIKIGNAYRFYPVSFEVGVEMAAQFGGTSYNVSGEGGQYVEVKHDSGFKGFWNAFIPGGADAVEGLYQNSSGNQVGSWLARLNFDYDKWYLGLYYDHFFEDHSQMFFLDYDGYGEGGKWNDREKNRYVLYDLKDIMLGVELKLKRNAIINNVVLEYLYSKYQSGPIYHDHNANISDHIGGNDNYYNHYLFTGWQHWGQVMGNPLFLSPLYNSDGKIEVKNNRMLAFHLGIGGEPNYNLSYRVLASWQKGYGTYSTPYSDPRQGLSVLAEASYAFSEYSPLKGWGLKAAFGMDAGKLRGDNYGFQITVINTGLLDFGKSRKKQ